MSGIKKANLALPLVGEASALATYHVAGSRSYVVGMIYEVFRNWIQDEVVEHFDYRVLETGTPTPSILLIYEVTWHWRGRYDPDVHVMVRKQKKLHDDLHWALTSSIPVVIPAGVICVPKEQFDAVDSVWRLTGDIESVRSLLGGG